MKHREMVTDAWRSLAMRFKITLTMFMNADESARHEQCITNRNNPISMEVLWRPPMAGTQPGSSELKDIQSVRACEKLNPT
jgi:hypothetical protein